MVEMQRGKNYFCGRSQLEVGRNLLQLKDSAGALGDEGLLRQRLKDDGYLYIRGFYGVEELEIVHTEISNLLKESGLLVFDSEKKKWVPSAENRGKLFKTTEYDQIKSYIDMISGEKIKDLFSKLRQQEIYTYPYKWLRAVPPSGHTGVHFDNIYMGRGSDQMLTCWTALEDIPLEKGGLLMGADFHNLHLLRNSYGALDLDRHNLDSGWYSRDLEDVTNYFGGKWYSSNFSAGDIVIFGMFQLHGSLNNVSDEYRISCDTRFQGVEEPRDARWELLESAGHTSNSSVKIDDLKKEWHKSFA